MAYPTCEAKMPCFPARGAGMQFAECAGRAVAEAEWSCPNGHRRRRRACARHMEAARKGGVGCAECLEAGVDVEATFTGEVPVS